jgi:hypothetical protein
MAAYFNPNITMYHINLFQKHARSNNMILDWLNAEGAVLFAQEIVLK